MSRYRFHTVALMLALSAGACSPVSDHPSSDHAAGYIDSTRSGDTTILHIRRALHPGGGTLVEELSVGSVDGPEEYVFGRGTIAAITQDGGMLIADGSVPNLREYDENGKYVRSFGRGGNGPGEYGQAAFAALHQDGRLFILERSLRRINVYSRAGESIDTWPLGVRSYGSLLPRLLVDVSGNLIVTIPLEIPAGFSRDQAEPSALLRMDPGGRVIDTLIASHLPSVPSARLSVMVRSREGTTTTWYASVPYLAQAVSAYSPLGYFVTAITSRYAVDLRMPTPDTGADRGPQRWRPGGPVISIRHGAAPIPVSGEERGEWRSDIQAYLQYRDPAWTWNGPDVPRFKPPIRSIQVGADGRIWVEVWLRSEKVPRTDSLQPSPEEFDAPMTWRQQGTAYDVFEPAGILLGRVDVPEDVLVSRMYGDRIWALVRDDDGLPYFKRYRVAWKP